MFAFVGRLEICRQSKAYRDFSQNPPNGQKVPKMVKKCPKNTILNLWQGYTPKKFQRVAKVPYLANPEHQKG